MVTVVVFFVASSVGFAAGVICRSAWGKK